MTSRLKAQRPQASKMPRDGLIVNYLCEISQTITKSNKKTVTKISIGSLLAEFKEPLKNLIE
jgi:hypothetical protein